jgi:hypothetical protein
MSLTQHDIWLESGAFSEDTEAERAREMAAREFYEPDYSRATVTPSAWIRATDRIGDVGEAIKSGFLGAFRDAWAIVSHPWTQFALGAILAVFTCWLAVEMFIAIWRSR